MVLKRQLGEGSEEASEVSNKRRHLLSNIFKGVSSARNLQDYLPTLEPMIRKWVREEVKSSFDLFFRPSDSPIEASGSKMLRLQFLNNVAHTVFTGNSVVSVDKTPIKIALYDSDLDEIVSSGPFSSMKVDIIVLEGDFAHDDWLKKDFNGKVVRNREGKRPLATGDLTVTLQNGEGYIGNFSFTDNSSWTRTGRFRLGVKAHFDDTSVGEGISNAFRVKDHRGESYKKHHPPSWHDEVWRIEKIGKDGASHKRLTQMGISCVGDFLRFYVMDHLSLRNVLGRISNKKWEAIVAHARTCILDGQSYPSLHSLNSSQMEMVDCDANFHVGLGHGNEVLETPSNSYHPAISSQENSSFEIGESSQMQALNMAFSNSFGMSDSSQRFYIGDEAWPAGMDSELSPQKYCKIDDNF